MKIARIAASGLALTALLAVRPSSNASARLCPVDHSTVGETRAAAQRVSKDFLTLRAAAANVGVVLKSKRQVILISVYPTFVDTRVQATGSSCKIIGAVATPTKEGDWVWTPRLPAIATDTRYISSKLGVIKVELKTKSNGAWKLYTATSKSMRWTSGTPCYAFDQVRRPKAATPCPA